MPALKRALPLLLLIAAACGRRGLQGELENVPSTALLHAHFERQLPPQAWSFLPASLTPVDPGLIRDLLDRGPLGISLVAVDLTSLKPQFMILSSSVGPDTMLAIAAKYMDFTADSAAGRRDLRSPRGRLLGSVAVRRGWTCLYLGPAPEAVVPQWLQLTRSGSLAADSALALVSARTGSDLSLFVPSSLVSFLGVAPVSAWVPWWPEVSSALALLQPRAARLDLSFRGFVAVELRVVREAARVTRVRFELEDSGFTPGEMLSALRLALGGSLF